MAPADEAESESAADQLERSAYTARTERRNEDALGFFSLMARAPDASAIQVARALKCRGLLLSELKRFGEALDAYESLLERFATTADHALTEQVAMALIEKGETLRELGRSDEALAIYAHVVRRFGRIADQAVRREVLRARNLIYIDKLRRSPAGSSD